MFKTQKNSNRRADLTWEDPQSFTNFLTITSDPGHRRKLSKGRRQNQTFSEEMGCKSFSKVRQ